MVLKLRKFEEASAVQFESDVISDGTQTVIVLRVFGALFESDVISDGTQTIQFSGFRPGMFESDVISDGTQTFSALDSWR